MMIGIKQKKEVEYNYSTVGTIIFIYIICIYKYMYLFIYLESIRIRTIILEILILDHSEHVRSISILNSSDSRYERNHACSIS